jgi:chemotaxis protein histidine kinase CheA
MVGKASLETDRMAVKITHLDRLLSLTGEIIITASNMSILQRHMQNRAHGLDKDSSEMVKNATITANRISSDLHHLVMDIRLIPIRETFLRFRRLVRDLAKKKGRQLNFEIVGEDTLVDKTVAERLYEPLSHQIRNAIDHGLEDPLERKKDGKNVKGQLTLMAYKKEGYTYVVVSDDGRGLDEEKIKQIAIEKGLITPQIAAGLLQADTYALIMKPGFSTARETTEISGRGVGMDVVKSTVDALGGEVIIRSQIGQGTEFTYKIPELSAVNIVDALIVRAGDNFFAVPITNVVATQAFKAGELHTIMKKGRSILYLGSIIPLLDLNGLLSQKQVENHHQDVIPVIIIEDKNGRLALSVSEFIRPQKLVLMPLPEVFNVSGVAGTTILGGSQLGLVLDPFELINLAQGSTQSALSDRYLSHATVAIDDDIAESETVTSGLATGSRQPGEPAESEAPGRKAPDRTGPPPQSSAEEDNGFFAEEFFLEIQQILSELNEEIFQLEKDPENTTRLNTIFRHFHSIKGNLIMTGFSTLGAFVHQVETVLDRMRDKELEASQEIIDLLLDAVKQLEIALREIRGGRDFRVGDDDLLALLEKYRRQDAPSQKEKEDAYDETFRLSALGQLLLQAKAGQGKNICQSMISFQSRFQEPFLVAYLILRRMALLGDVIDTVPSLEKIEQGLVIDAIKVLFATDHGQEEVNRFMEAQLKRYYDVVDYENLFME